MKMATLLLALSIGFFLVGASSGQQQNQDVLARVVNERAELRVPTQTLPTTINYLERLTNHLGGKVLSSGEAAGGYEMVVRIPDSNASHFRDLLGTTTKVSSDTSPDATIAFRIVLIPTN